MNKIAVIGLGYVGLPLALLAENKKFDVVGIDLSKEKIEALKNHKPVIDDKQANVRLKKSTIKFSADFSLLKDRDIVLICVPTPVDTNKTPDLNPVRNAVKNAVRHMKKNSLLVIESTINPGVCEEIVMPIIEGESDHTIGKTLYLAHCPERINPGDQKWTVDNINRVVGADSEKGLEIAYSFYSRLIDAKIKKMSNIKEAEAVKIVENTFRDVNIAFVNELAMSFAKLGINATNVIDGAATKPFAFMPHYPGIGIGGHCIPVDPYYLIEYARGKGFNHEFLTIARSINEAMPVFSVGLLEKEFIEKTKRTLEKVDIAVLGLSYKPNVGDDRESPAYKVVDILKKRGANVKTYDPFIKKGSTEKSLSDAVGKSEAIIIVTAHDEFQELSSAMMKNAVVFLDGRNAFGHLRDELFEKNISYLSIGGS